MVHKGLVAGLLLVELCLGQGESIGVLVRDLAIEQKGVARIQRCKSIEVAHFLCSRLLALPKTLVYEYANRKNLPISFLRLR